jgi:hypothetical protein
MSSVSSRPILRRLPGREGYPFAERVKREPVLQQVAELGTVAFGETAFSKEKFRALLRANHNILFVVRDAAGRVEGYADVIPVRREFGDDLLSGRKKEADIGPNDVIPERELSTAAGGYIYLAAFVTRSALQKARAKARGLDRTFQKLIWAALERIFEITTMNPKITKALALAYETPDHMAAPGLIFLERFQFVEQGRSAEGFPVFVFDLGHQAQTFVSHFDHISEMRHRHVYRKKRRIGFLAVSTILFGCLALATRYLFVRHKDSWEEVTAVFVTSAVGVFLIERVLTRLWKKFDAGVE